MADGKLVSNLSSGTRLDVFNVKDFERADGTKDSMWNRCGSAFVNKDGSLNVLLDLLPADGKLHIRAPSPKKEVEAAE